MKTQTGKLVYATILLNVTIYLFSFAVLAQKSPISNPTSQNIESACVLFDPELVYVWVTVKFSKGQLKVEDFKITENGHQQFLEIYRQLPQTTKNTSLYKIGYYSTDVRRDGKTRKIQVTLQPKEKKQLEIEYWPKKYQAKIVS